MARATWVLPSLEAVAGSVVVAVVAGEVPAWALRLPQTHPLQGGASGLRATAVALGRWKPRCEYPYGALRFWPTRVWTAYMSQALLPPLYPPLLQLRCMMQLDCGAPFR